MKKQYYKLLNNTIKQFYERNHYNRFNQGYSLLINRFTSRRQSTRILMDEDADYDINWKNYLLEKLENDPNEQIWKRSLYNIIKKETFIKQYYFQNKSFFEEFSFLTDPKTSKKEGIFNSLLTEPVLSSIDSRELKSLSKSVLSFCLNPSLNDDQMVTDYNGKNLDYSNDIDHHLTMNISMESITSTMANSDPKYEAQLNSRKIKGYIKIIKNHLDNKSHPITIIINRFIEVFKPYLNKAEQECKNKKMDKNECSKIGRKIVTQIQNFIETMQVVLKLFYSKSINYKYFIDEKDEIINLICYILFNHQTIYKSLANIFSYMNYEKIIKLQQQFIKIGDLTPTDVGISQKFCLNKVTEEYMEQCKKNIINEKKPNKVSKLVKFFESNNYNKNNNNNIIENEDEKNLDEEDNITYKTENINKQKISDYNSIIEDDEKSISTFKLKDFKDTLDSYQDEMDIKDLLLNDIEKEGFPSLPKKPDNNNTSKSRVPYSGAISYLRQIDTYKVPLEKLIVIAIVSVIITDSVDKYWEPMKGELPGKFLNIDADELMSIYLYIIYQLKMPSLYVQLDFIKYFTTNISKQSMIGYYYTALEGCLNFILNLENKESLLKDK